MKDSSRSSRTVKQSRGTRWSSSFHLMCEICWLTASDANKKLLQMVHNNLLVFEALNVFGELAWGWQYRVQQNTVKAICKGGVVLECLLWDYHLRVSCVVRLAGRIIELIFLTFSSNDHYVSMTTSNGRSESQFDLLYNLDGFRWSLRFADQEQKVWSESCCMQKGNCGKFKRSSFISVR